MVTMARELERGLIEPGVSPEQAERIAVGLDERLREVATKQDLRELQDQLRRELDQRFADVHSRIENLNRTMWRVFLILVTLGVAGFGALFGALMYAVFG